MENVLLVFGGESYEHDISIVTASQFFNKTKLNNVNIVPLYLSKNNLFYIYVSKVFNIKDFAENELSSKKFKEVVFVSGEKNKLFLKTRFGLKEYLNARDVIFACHGGIGENGELVSFFKNLGFGTSAGNFGALSICMDKFLFKQTMRGLRLPVVSGFKITKFEYENSISDFKHRIKFLKFPVIIKSNSGGSSIGLFVANSRDEFDDKIKMAFEFDDAVLIENYIENSREFNVAVLGNCESFVVSEIDEPLKENEVLTFADKYLAGGGEKYSKKIPTKNSMASSIRKFPADLSNELTKTIKQIAGKVFKSLNLSGVVRIDFLYQEKTNKIYICEVNAIPGSLAYYFFDENRISTNSLAGKLIEISKKNKNAVSCVKKEYYTNILG